MRKLVIALMLLGLSSACTTNGVYDSGKTWTLVGAIVVGSAVIASQKGSDSPVEECVDTINPFDNSGINYARCP